MNSWQRERLRLSIGTVIPTEGYIDAPPTAIIMEKFSENRKILTLLLGTDAQKLNIKLLLSRLKHNEVSRWLYIKEKYNV